MSEISEAVADYAEGRAAFLDGRDENSCPHPPGHGGNTRRIKWFNGYFDERTATRLAKLFRRYKIQWP